MVAVKLLRCYRCKKKFSARRIIFECDRCGGSLDIEYDYDEIKKHILKEEFKRACVSHWKYWPFYPIEDLTRIVSMEEGGTPLILDKESGFFFKLECVNPTGSFKDRGSTVEISKVVELGVNEIVCASTGNMGASIAAYASKAGIKATIFVPEFAPKVKAEQIKSYGAKVVFVKGSYTDALNKTKELRRKKGVYLTGDYPYRCEGEKGVGFEIIDQLDWQIPDYVCCPIGNGTLLYGVYKSFAELKEVGLIKRLPRLVGVQAKGCNPVVRAFHKDMDELPKLKKTKTVAGAINCPDPVDGLKALHAIRKTSGDSIDVSDREIMKARSELGKKGIYAEPAGAVSYAGAKKLGLKGRVVCVVTGHGLKDPFVKLK
ncbi:threonine synthase [Candidatus Woesearchaeota archaeon]|nr:MAG: threonine synthase [Candidatus Woesearchaeota archaeon]